MKIPGHVESQRKSYRPVPDQAGSQSNESDVMKRFGWRVVGLCLLALGLMVTDGQAGCLKTQRVSADFKQTLCPGTENERTVTKTAKHTVVYSTPGCEVGSGGGTGGGTTSGGTGGGGGGWWDQGSGGGGIGGSSPTLIEGQTCFKPSCLIKRFFGESEDCTGSSVILANGTYNFTETDLVVPARGIPIVWFRHYRSNRILPKNGGSFGEPQDGPLGYGWMTPYFARIENGDTHVDGQGLYTVFEKDSSGNYLTDQINGLVLKKTATGYELKEIGGLISLFDLTGRLVAMKDLYGNTVTLSYNAEGQLAAVTDAAGRTALSFTYNAAGRIETVTDVADRTVAYQYDAFGHLTEVDGLGESAHSYTYNTYHGVTSKANALGETYTIEYQYADRGIVKKVIDPIGTGLIDEGKPPTGHVKSFAYDFQNGVFYVTDYDGTVTKTTANSDGRLTSKERVEQSGSVALKNVELQDNRTEVVTDAAGNEKTIQRDEWFNIIRITDGEGNTTRMSWNGQKRPTKTTDPLGVVTAFEYDATGTLLLKKTEALGTSLERLTTYTYTDYGEPETVTIGGATTTLAYAADGRVKSVTNPLGDKSTLDYDAAGQLTAVIDATGNRSTLTYDELGNVLSATNPLEQVTRFAYNLEGRLEKVTDALGRETTVESDFKGRTLAVVDSLNNRKEFEYDGGGNLLSITQGEAVSSFSYDATDRLSSVTDAEGNTTSYDYAAAGCSTCGASTAIPETITDPFGNATKNLFDKTGRVIGVQDPLTNLTSLAYDARGQVILQTDGNGNVIRFEYDPLGRVTKQTDAEGGVTAFTYDIRDNLLSLTDPEQQTTTFEYDLAGRKTKEIRPMGQETIYSYYANGLPKTDKDAKQQVTRYTYDKANRLTEITYADDTQDTFGYDTVGNLTSYANPAVSGTLAYDALNRKLSETVDYGPFQKTFSYSYDVRGNKQTYTSPEGLDHSYTYRKNDQLKTISVDGKTFTFDYDKHRLSKLTFPNGVVTDYAFNPNSWLTGITTTGAGGAVLTRSYTHDSIGNIQTKNTEHGLYEYGYDQTYQLTSADNPTMQDEGYSYDQVGNRQTSLSTAGLWSHNANNELITDTAATFEYDANGNTTKKTEGGRVTRYEYNARNRLEKIYLPDGRIATYGYDPFGRRIRKRVANTVTYFAYADEGMIAEYAEEGAPQKTYGWKPGGLWGTDPLCQIDGGQMYFYHNDHLATPQLLTDEAGAVVWGAGFQAFGLAVVDPASTVENNLRFPGQYWDAETGLHYNWNRTYDPVTGRYTQVDPIGFAGGDVNVYRYVGNNAGNFADPYGLWVNPVHWWLDRHYKRNDYNRPASFEEVQDSTLGWREEPDIKAVYHRMGKGNENNRKFVNSDGREHIYRPDGTLGILVTGSVNMGTFNYIDPKGAAGSVGHILVDVILYYLLGNSLDDPTTMYERMTASYEGSEEIQQDEKCP